MCGVELLMLLVTRFPRLASKIFYSGSPGFRPTCRINRRARADDASAEGVPESNSALEFERFGTQ